MSLFLKGDLTPELILSHVETIYDANYSSGDIPLVSRIFTDIIDLFEGRRSGYQRCDTMYHDLHHTMQTIPPFVEIIDGWNKAGAAPRISSEFFQLGVAGVLLHDTGYIKTDDDREGTGAKYTMIHVQRSVDFARAYLTKMGLPESTIRHIINIISCTGVTLDMNINFLSAEERITGCALGTADLLGQMSAPDYIDHLPVLYNEFAESYGFAGLEKLHGKGSTLFANADELIRSTPKFYEDVALKRFAMMGSLEKYITYHYGGDENPYLAGIEKNIETIRRQWGK